MFLSEEKNTEEIMTKLRAKGKNIVFNLRTRCGKFFSFSDLVQVDFLKNLSIENYDGNIFM